MLVSRMLAASSPLIVAAVLVWWIHEAPVLLPILFVATAISFPVMTWIAGWAGQAPRAIPLLPPVIFATCWGLASLHPVSFLSWAAPVAVGGVAALVFFCRPRLAERWRLGLETALAPTLRMALLLLLGIVYFGVLLPIALVLRKSRLATMPLAPDATLASYWEDLPTRDTPDRYLRQY
ncbi:MAG: hypothetical protein ABIJ09_26960 [Pseudomonadota bacterium]